jgi:hypothetical protein
MPYYADDDFERIAAAVGKDVADIKCYEKALEAAAMWHRLNRNAPTGERICRPLP